jgi:UPF0755 protein
MRQNIHQGNRNGKVSPGAVRRSVKTKLIVLGLLLGVIVICLGVAGWWWQDQLKPVDSGNSDAISFVIPKDQSAITTINNLSERQLIKSVPAARIYLMLTGIDQKIQNGTFILKRSQTLPELLTALTQGPKDIWVTIPEGWRREQIADRLSANLEEFDKIEFLRTTQKLEGQLFPDTYLLPRSSTPSEVVKIMTENFTKRTSLELPRQYDDLILASLIEREGKTDTDRPVIAAILKKRLQAGWPLQVDATVQYAKDTEQSGWWKPISDTKFPSVYNTYLNPGLPPTPICNPGLSSIQAVATAGTTPYWYYLHAPDGQVYYGATLEEHNRNIDKYL